MVILIEGITIILSTFSLPCVEVYKPLYWFEGGQLSRSRGRKTAEF